MFKRSTVPATILSALALTTLCLLSAVITAQIQAPANQMTPKSIAALDSMNLEFAPQKGPQGTTGAPIRGAEVKLGSNPGGNAAARTTTDESGNFTFTNVPAGSYSLTVSLKTVALKEKPKVKGSTSGSSSTGQASENGAVDSRSSGEAIEACLITISDAKAGMRTVGWNLVTNKTFDPNPTAKAALSATSIDVVSNGRDPVNGTIREKLKRKSNIANNRTAN